MEVDAEAGVSIASESVLNSLLPSAKLQEEPGSYSRLTLDSGFL